jgi:hypothetical protein
MLAMKSRDELNHKHVKETLQDKQVKNIDKPYDIAS